MSHLFIWKRDRKNPGVAVNHGYNPGAWKSEQVNLAFLARLENIPKLTQNDRTKPKAQNKKRYRRGTIMVWEAARI